MSSQYRKNNFSTESLSASLTTESDNINRTIKPNIENLLKKIHVERRREKKNIITLGFVTSSIILIVFFIQS